MPRHDANIFAETYIETLNNLYCEAFPLKTKFVKRKYYFNSWVTPDIKTLLQAKSDYFYLFKMKIISKEENNVFKNKVYRIIKSAKVAYYNKLFQKNAKNMKNTWKNINFLLSRHLSSENIKKIIFGGLTYESDIDIANIFNQYFCSIGDELESQIPAGDLDPLLYVDSNLTSSFWLNPVTPVEVENIIRDLKDTKANLNMIDVSSLKENSNFVAITISDLINVCFCSGVFPIVLKKSYCIASIQEG